MQLFLEDGTAMAKYSLTNGSVLVFKDLGAQISYKGVFVVEYGGPIILYALFYFFFYGSTEKTFAQKVGLDCFILHFIKREFETLFIHRFSHGTMPVYPNLFKNCAHYWGAGIYLGYFVNSKSTTESSPTVVWIAVAIWALMEIGNLITHIQLRNLRPEGSKKRSIPYGLGFNLVSCPNYFFEVGGWVAYSVIVGGIWGWVFTIAGFAQMYLWAVKKHRAYKKDFPNYPKSRKIMIPFVL